MRELLAEAIGPDAPLRLERLTQGYRLVAGINAALCDFEAPTAEECYAQALLAALP